MSKNCPKDFDMKKLTQVELDEVLRLHQIWLNDDESGAKANLKANLSNRDLSNCDFHIYDVSYCDFSKSILINCNFSRCILNHCDFSESILINCDFRYCKFRGSSFKNANFEGVNLTGADLNAVDLRYCDLTGANLDFSTGIPLHCGGLNIKLDKRLMCQLIYHLCSMQCDDIEIIELQNYMLEIANQSHVIDKHGLGKIDRKVKG